jgi:hypothetical protein
VAIYSLEQTARADTGGEIMKQQMTNVGGRFLRLLSMFVGLAIVFASVSFAGSTQRTDERYTVIGCIKRSAADVPSTPGTTAIMAGQTRYVLVNITLSGRGAVTKDPGAPAAALITQNVNMYRLDDSTAAEIAPHVGERVEVTGTLVNEPDKPAGTTGRIDQSLSLAKSPVLKIQSLRTISANSDSCTR